MRIVRNGETAAKYLKVARNAARHYAKLAYAHATFTTKIGSEDNKTISVRVQVAGNSCTGDGSVSCALWHGGRYIYPSEHPESSYYVGRDDLAAYMERED